MEPSEMVPGAPVLPGDCGAAETLLKLLGCRRCQVRQSPSNGRIFSPCLSCARMPAFSPGNGGGIGEAREPGSYLLTMFSRQGWVFTIAELAKYCDEKTKAPWVRVQWPSGTELQTVAIGNAEAMTRAGRSGFGGRAAMSAVSHHVPAWLQVLLDVGTVLRRGRYNGGPMGFDWPRVITHFSERPEDRPSLLTVIQSATTSKPLVAHGIPTAGTEDTVDPVPIATYLRISWPQLIGDGDGTTANPKRRVPRR